MCTIVCVALVDVGDRLGQGPAVLLCRPRNGGFCFAARAGGGAAGGGCSRIQLSPAPPPLFFFVSSVSGPVSCCLKRQMSSSDFGGRAPVFCVCFKGRKRVCSAGTPPFFETCGESVRPHAMPRTVANVSPSLFT